MSNRSSISGTVRSFQSFAAFLFLFTAASVFAQPPAPVATPTLAPAPTPELVSGTKTTDDKGELKPYVFVKTVGLKVFGDEADRLGKLGYRLEYMAPYGHTVGVAKAADPVERYRNANLGSIFKLDKGSTYEYEWFEAETPGEMVTRLNDRAGRGFYFRHSVPASDDSDCGGGSGSSDTTAQLLDNILAMTCVSHNAIYFVEKKNGLVDKREYRLHFGKMGWGKNPSEEISKLLNDTAQHGFRPVAIGWITEGFNSGTYAVIERPAGDESKPTGITYKFLRNEFGFTKKVNELAKDGYRLKFDMTAIAQELALVEKAPGSESAAPASYRWIDATGKTSEQELAAAYNAGVRFAMTNREAEDLIFEDVPPGGDKYEYKTLDMYSYPVKPTKKNPNPPPPKPQEQIYREFDQAIADGYAIRDIYISQGIKVLFERKK